MVRSEVGKMPLLVDIVSRSVSYIKHVGFNMETLANIALDNELSLYDESNILSLTRNFSPYFNNNTNYLIPECKTEIKKKTSEWYNEVWSQGITALSKADTFRSVKTSIAFEQYLGLVKTINIE